MPMKYCLRFLANPAYTSKIEEKLRKEVGLDKHTASVYTLILKYLDSKVSRLSKYFKYPK